MMISFILMPLIFDSVAVLQGDIVVSLFWQSSPEEKAAFRERNCNLDWNRFA